MKNFFFNICRAEQYRDGMGPALVQTGSTPVQLELGPPFKKIRFGEPKPDVQQPLRIDTRASTVVKMNRTCI
jgi:hypothetical protein